MLKKSAPLLAIVVILLGALGVSAFGTAKPSEDLCSDVQSLFNKIYLDQQMMKDFGFDKSVAEMQEAADLPLDHVAIVRDEFKSLLFSAAQTSAFEALRATGALPEPKQRDIEDATAAYGVADAARKRQMLAAAVKAADLAWSLAKRAKPLLEKPTFSSELLEADAWAWEQVYKSAHAVRTVKKLTETTEANLKALKVVSERYREEVRQLSILKRNPALQTQCNSTNLVRKPSGPSTGKVVAEVLGGAAIGVGGIALASALGSTSNTAGGTSSSPSGGCAGASYCGTISAVGNSLTATSSGLGYQYSGSLDLQFSPAPPAGMTIGAQLNGASIHGTAVTNGSSSLHIVIAGSSVACQRTNPSTYVILDMNHLSPVLAFLDFNWPTPGCP